MERQDDADEQHADDQAVEPGIGHEGVEDLALQHEGDQRAQDQEHQHPDQKDAGRGELGLIEDGSPSALSLWLSAAKSCGAQSWHTSPVK